MEVASTMELNMKLSKERADAVAAYLASQGVPRERIASIFAGRDFERQPIVDACEPSEGYPHEIESADALE
jgi:outer membrane protein OmpA-like peptidoglycan-associated protein